ncbi:DUF1810 domain-containing protein [Cyanobacterium aponinum AL20118]|uniref:DUF1810 domain-containing protein n=1 Tax=Cyanobacterium aponinum AL20115 TaxID=3090662 RepID=A0AAF0ZK32_9CHRO|nr:DUF1810 domain-containing protein [Cyanobacterium aponinum]WPF89882.1 DUF1810 domain-containing protein [Cyanobacterium aponinum AL20115]
MTNNNSYQDLYNLQRFVDAQEKVYKTVIDELKNAKKRSHWMWFIFPQINGLGKTSTSIFYSIKSIQEAKQYINHDLLGKRLKECVTILLTIEETSSEKIFGFPDCMKLKSSLTLFSEISDSDSIFHQGLNKFFRGSKDEKTLQILSTLER